MPTPSSTTLTFGAFLAEQRRSRAKQSLRAFCADHGFDPGNLSKLERGRLPPPQSPELLEKYGRALDIPEGSEDWFKLFDLAAAENGRVPDDLLNKEEIVRKLPFLFEALREAKAPDDERLEWLTSKLREA